VLLAIAGVVLFAPWALGAWIVGLDLGWLNFS
jgi:hypothetical protein